MKRLILHIGTPKTGSTSIQEAFARVGTPDFRYAYLDFWENHSEALGIIFLKDPTKAMHLEVLKPTPRKIERKKRLFSARFDREMARPEQTLMMSGELLSRFNRREVKRLKERIQQSGRELFVFAYVRDPISYFSSIFQESLKYYHTQNNRPIGLNYWRMLRPWYREIDRDHLIVRPFDHETFHGGSAVNNLAEIYSLPMPPQLHSKNSGLSDPTVRLLWLFSGLDLPQPRTWQNVMRRLRLIEVLNAGLDGAKFKLPPETLRVTDRMRRQAEWLKMKTGIDFSPELDEASLVAQKIPINDALTEIAPSTQQRLRQILDKRSIATGPNSTVQDELLALYNSFSKIEIQQEAWQRFTDDGGARLRRSVHERLRHPLG